VILVRAHKTKMLIGMCTMKTLHEVSDGIQDSIGDWTRAIHIPFWQRTSLYVVYALDFM
jgi:hypothetical protein